MELNFYNVDTDYIDYLKKYEERYRGFTRVPNVKYHSGNNKFFYGAVLTVNNIDYFVPVSSNTRVKQDDILIVVKDKKKSQLWNSAICLYDTHSEFLYPSSDKR